MHTYVSIHLAKLNYAFFMPHKYIFFRLEISTYFRIWKNYSKFSTLLTTALQCTGEKAKYHIFDQS